MRREALGRLRVEEDVRLVGAPVDGGTAELGEPDRLGLRRPRRRRPALHPARAVVMRVRPPGAQILVAEDPRLAGGAVGDRGADLRGAVGGAGIEPVEAFAARDVRLQVGPVVDRGPALGRVEHGRTRRASPTAACSCRCRRNRSPDRPRADRGGRTRRRCRRPAGARNTPTSRPHSRSSCPDPRIERTSASRSR